jgi:hypothetical protein
MTTQGAPGHLVTVPRSPEVAGSLAVGVTGV